ncbi:23S rRNA (adenine(2503)-C(2))-methyltransferase RlmN [bacterium]|nr:23S rRNA (adenine(2503)-C(2))-methyltransferase RlmN [bacterium]
MIQAILLSAAGEVISRAIERIMGRHNGPQPEQMQDFFSLTRPELEEVLTQELGMPRYRADQLFRWVYHRGVCNPEQMTDIGKRDRERLRGVFSFPDLTPAHRAISSDGTRKYLFAVSSGNEEGEGDRVESVMIKQPARMTLCVSSQVGCALGCTFCQTGTMGLTRHLTEAEILTQVFGVVRDAEENFGDMFSNMVFMGMGEPFHNYDGVTRAISLLNDPHGLALAPRKITVSTAGLVPAIRRFFEEGVGANLAVSLNATTNEVRDAIMPINKRYPLEELLGTLRALQLPRRKKITIEYVLLRGVNDSEGDLQRLPKLLRGIPAKVNLIPYNFNDGLGFHPPAEDTLRRWQSELQRQGVVVTVRWSKGRDIDAACGQLVTSSTRRAKKEAARRQQQSELVSVSQRPNSGENALNKSRELEAADFF